MSVTLADTNLTLSWPLASESVTLQSRTNLAHGNWEDVPSSVPKMVGDQWQVVLPASINSASIFYRLVE